MKPTRLLIFCLLAVFMCCQTMCGTKGTPVDNADDDNGDDDDDDNDDNDVFDDDSQFEDDDNSGDDETDTYMDGCEGVDFLFVIDNSRSMEDEQQNLINSFPGFMEAITEVIEIDNYHIMAIDSDARYGLSRQDCDRMLGAGHVGQNEGPLCDIQGEPDQRYLSKGQTDLNESFACIAGVGVNGNGYEKLMEAQSLAVGPLEAPGQCNAGFIRDKALLVTTFITDEDEECTDGGEDCSDGNPASWKADLVTAKNGNERAIVVLGVFGDNDLDDGICTEYDTAGDGAMPAPLLRQYLELWDEDRRQYCSVCLPDYSECFLDAVDIIDQSCNDLE